MPLATSYTLNIGSPAADVVFDNQVKLAGAVVYTASSPQGDLEGRPSLTVTGVTRKNGLVSHLVNFKFPQWNSTLNKYDGYITAQMTVTRQGNHNVAQVERALEAIREFLNNSAGAASVAIASGSL